MAVHGVPRAILHWLLDSPRFMKHIYRFARIARRMQETGRWKDRVVDRMKGRPNILQLLIDNTNRDQLRGEDLTIQPNVDHSPFARKTVHTSRPWAEATDHPATAGLS
jgi:hypothetical protein